MSERPPENRQRIARVTLDEHTVVRRSPEVEHERAVAIFDLLEDNHFAPAGDDRGPYDLHLAIEENRLAISVSTQAGAPVDKIALALASFRRLVKDYFTVCESYYAAIKRSTPGQIEAIDMGRRSLHNEGAELLRQRLADRVAVDPGTARRLFTLLCVLHIRG
ncbi:MAG: UPF0262 family protein [Dongiaceae bacterium]